MRRLWLFAIWWSLIALLSSSAAAADGDLLAGRKPSKSQGVATPAALNDGVRAPEGDDWSGPAATRFESSRSFVEYDLGKVTPIKAAYLQGDNNDEYIVSVSDDGRRFKRLWTAQPVDAQGLRQRVTTKLSGSGRYVRVTASGGDGSFALSEVALYRRTPSVFPPKLKVKGSGRNAASVRDHVLGLVFAGALFLFASRRKSRWWTLAAAAPLVVASVLLVQAAAAAWPLGGRELSMLRAAMAGLAGLALLRGGFLRAVFPAERKVVTGVLALTAVVAAACFYNLGVPQFQNEKENRAEFVHTWDMRVYYPFAKYFDELGYDGVYLASAGAYLDDVEGASLQSIGKHDIRSLDTLRVQKLEQVGPEIERVKARFEPERWQRFKEDMTYFREVMGKDYLRTLADHGANATPVWIACAKLVFGWAPASEGMLVWGGLVDALLLLGVFVAIWRTFGLRPMLVALVVFGANDFYMFGTNWGGATLRHDWLAYLGFGVCALRANRYTLAGALFGLSTLIRAFPGLALAGVALPALWWVIEQWRKDGALPGVRAILAANQPAVRVLVAAGATMVLLVLLTGVMFGFGAWAEWWSKIVALNSSIGVNDVSLKALIAAGDEARPRRLLLGASTALCVAVVVCACRGRKLEHAALLALPLIPVLGNPSSYYLHLIFLLPLLGHDTSPAKAGKDLTLVEASLPLLAVCVAQYWTALDPDAGRHFQAAVALLFAGLAWLFASVLKKSLPTWPELAPPPKST